MSGSIDLSFVGGRRKPLRSSSMYGITAGGLWVPILVADDGSIGVTGGGLDNDGEVTFWTAKTTNGAGTPAFQTWDGGPGMISVFGTWGTATVQFAFSPDDTTYIDSDGVLFSAADATMNVWYPPGRIKATIATASGPTSLTAMLQSTR